MNTLVDVRTATPDPPPSGIPNPIHDAEGADAAGYAGALVAGVRTYGWAAQAIVRALGDDWLGSGWVDFSLRRPLFAGEELTTTVRGNDDGTCDVECVGRGGGGERVVLDGTAGRGEAAWFDELAPPAPRAGLDPPPVRPTYDLGSIPLRRPLRPLRVHVKAEAARQMALDDLGLDDPRYGSAADTASSSADTASVPVHPYFLAGRMAPLTRHNFTYGPTIHVRSQIQHRREARSGCDITVGAQIVDAYAHNEHWYQVLDGLITEGDGGDLRELAVIRHHTIFRPRGTTMPAPIDRS